MGCFERLAPLCSGAQGVIYDTALRGTHHQRLLRHLGLLPINKVTAKKKGASTARRNDEEQRQEKSVHLETKTLHHPNGTTTTLDLYARSGSVGIGRLLDTGDLEFVPLQRIRTHRNGNKGQVVFTFGNPGDLPLAADFDGDGLTEVGLFRPTTGLMYFRNTHTPGVADVSFFWGDPADRVIAGDWDADGTATPGLFRPSDVSFYLRNSNTAGPADVSPAYPQGEPDWLPVAGTWGLG